MNYERVYKQLVEKRKREIFEGYGENHHIIPKCLGGQNKPENIVRLTAREHFIAHALLCKIYPNKNKLWFAFNCMCNKWGQSDRRNERYYKISSRIYDWCKKHYSKVQSELKKGSILSNECRKSISDTLKRKYANGEIIKQHPSGEKNGMYGRKQSQKCKEINSQIHKGRKYSSEIAYKNKKRGPEHPRYGKHWGPEFGQKQTLAKCYTQLLRYKTNEIKMELWDIHKIMQRNKKY